MTNSATIQARMNHPAMILPGAMEALLALGKSERKGGVPARTIDLIHLRASQITEAVTRISDREDPVPDEIWQEVAKHYDESAIAALIIAIANINVWNRLNVATRQVAGDWLGKQGS